MTQGLKYDQFNKVLKKIIPPSTLMHMIHQVDTD